MSIAYLPCYEINLDLDPEVRYLSVFVNFQENIKVIYQKFYDSIQENRKGFFKELSEVIKILDKDYYKEMESLAQIIDMDIEKCIAVDHICEAVTGCTSIITRMIDEETGKIKIVHGRSLDYPIEVQLMRESLYKAVFIKNGKEICVALVFAGFQGIYTGIKSNDTFINCSTFEEAVAYLSETPAINPCYLTICGIDRGAKLTKDRLKTRTEWVYTEDCEEVKGCSTYDVQTNCDTWDEPPERDNGRLKAARELLEAIQVENLNEVSLLYSVLHVSPVCNKDTVYCAFMDPKTYRCTVLIPDDEKVEENLPQ